MPEKHEIQGALSDGQISQDTTNEETGEVALDSQMNSVNTVCQDIKRQSLNIILKWIESFNESEKFDNFFESRIEELINEAKKLEETLVDQKSMLKERLRNLTKTLTLVTENES